MKRLLLVLAFCGCGELPPSTGGETDWSVTLGNWEAPMCEGTMRTTGLARVSGQWTCGTFGRAVSGEIRPDGRVFLDLETSPGFFNRVRGTMADTDAIAGDILLSDVDVHFAAYRQ